MTEVDMAIIELSIPETPAGMLNSLGLRVRTHEQIRLLFETKSVLTVK